MSFRTAGIHHVTGSPAIRSETSIFTPASSTRLVKRTVNFDDPTTYHFYFGNENGSRAVS